MRRPGLFLTSALALASCAIPAADIVSSIGAAGAAGSSGVGGLQESEAGGSDRAGSEATAGASNAEAGKSGKAGAGGAGGPASGGAGNPGGNGAGGSNVAGSAGSPGSAGSAPAQPSVCDGLGSRFLTSADALVDNFEGATLLSGWSSFNDTNPPNAFALMRAAGGAMGTAAAGHYAGTGAKTPTAGGYGVGTAFNLAVDPPDQIYCADVTAFDGLAFWAKGSGSVSLEFAVAATTPTTQYGDCKANCYNHPTQVLALTSEWKQYKVPFSAAVGSTGAKVNGHIQQLEWVSLTSSWDFWLDEITLY